MKWIFMLFITSVTVNGVTSSESGSCPAEWFQAVVTLVGEHKVSPALLNERDPNFTFFSDLLNFNNSKIDETEREVLQFFNTTHGLDFSQSTPNESGDRKYQNATLYVFHSPLDLYAIFNCWLLNGDITSQCYQATIGGYGVRFAGPQILYGTYGGEDGRLVVPGDVLGYQFYYIPVCSEDPLIFQYHTIIPIRYEPMDQHTVSNMEIFYPGMGIGRLSGVFRFSGGADGLITVVMRAVITFPDSPENLIEKV